jgi:hypothetical protein
MQEAVFGPVQGLAKADQGRTPSQPPPQPAPATSPSADLSDFIEAAGLLEYDPAAISRIYAGHPQRLIQHLASCCCWRAADCSSAAWRPDPAHGEAADLVASGPALGGRSCAPASFRRCSRSSAQFRTSCLVFDSALAMACIEEDLGARSTRSTPSWSGNRSPPPPRPGPPRCVASNT